MTLSNFCCNYNLDCARYQRYLEVNAIGLYRLAFVGLHVNIISVILPCMGNYILEEDPRYQTVFKGLLKNLVRTIDLT